MFWFFVHKTIYKTIWYCKKLSNYEPNTYIGHFQNLLFAVLNSCAKLPLWVLRYQIKSASPYFCCWKNVCYYLVRWYLQSITPIDGFRVGTYECVCLVWEIRTKLNYWVLEIYRWVGCRNSSCGRFFVT